MSESTKVAMLVIAFLVVLAIYILAESRRRAGIEKQLRKERDELLARERPKTIRATYAKQSYGLSRGCFLAGYQAAIGAKLSAPAAASIEMRNAATLLRLSGPISDSITHAYSAGVTQIGAALNEISVIDAEIISQAVRVAIERRVQALNEVDRPAEGKSDA